MGLRGAVKRFVVGTSLESPLKEAHHRLTGSKNSLYDVQTIAILRRVLRPDSLAVDIGAHEGGMLRHMLRLAPRGRHIAVEPMPAYAARLRERFPRCRVVEAALGDQPGTRDFVEITNLPAFSGLVLRGGLPAHAQTRRYAVHVETLDRIVPEGHAVALVKIDVEGGEYGVFRGAVATLRRCRPVVVFECGLGGADSYGTRPEDLHALIRDEIGLRVFTLQGYLERSAPLERRVFQETFERGLEFYFVAAP